MSSVLVVDDTPETAEFTRLILHSARYAVAVCGGDRAALAALAGGAPDVVVLDLDMPEIDGCQVLRRIRGNPALAGTRVLIYTATADPTASAPSDVAPDAVLAKDAARTSSCGPPERAPAPQRGAATHPRRSRVLVGELADAGVAWGRTSCSTLGSTTNSARPGCEPDPVLSRAVVMRERRIAEDGTGALVRRPSPPPTRATTQHAYARG